MHSSTSRIALRRLIVLSFVVACAAVSAVGASASRTIATSDVVERYAAAHDPNSATAPDVIERYVTVHSPGVAGVAPTVGTGRIAVGSFRNTSAYSPATSTGHGGLDWADFGIGAGAMFGLTLLLAALGLAAVAIRHRDGRFETS